MMPSLGTGGEQSFFPFETISERPRLTWPQDVRLTVMVVVHIETMDMSAPAETVADPRWRARIWPDPRLGSWLDYGCRVGVFRVLELLDRLSMPVTVATDALSCDRYPGLIGRFMDRGDEVAASGLSANRMLSSAQNYGDEKAAIKAVLERIERRTGRPVSGWIGHDFGESSNTPRLLAAAGLNYLADWPNDDEPYRMAGADGLVSLPVAHELDDVRLFMDRRAKAWDYPNLVDNAMNQLMEEGRARPRVLPLAIHPWVFGAPHRFRYLADTLLRLADRPGLWMARGQQLVDIVGQAL